MASLSRWETLMPASTANAVASLRLGSNRVVNTAWLL
jgi:hypothetical protein